jgi:oligosaccharyltransferase complex subunit beta
MNPTLLINWLARQFKVAFESPKNEALSLFRHGELAYDHLILAPPKSKG